MQCQQLGCLEPATRALDIREFRPAPALKAQARRYHLYRCDDHAAELRRQCELGLKTLIDDRPAKG